MAHEYRLTMSQELSYLELDALAWRVHEAGYTSGDNFIFKLAQEQEKYLHSEEHRKQQLLKRIEEIEVNSESEAASPKPDPENTCAADDREQVERSRSEELSRLMEDTRRLSRKADIKFAVALGIAIAAIALRIFLAVEQTLH